MQPFGYHLRGIDPDSDVFKGRTVFLLESIMKRIGTSGTGFRMPSNKSLVSTTSSSNPTNKQEDQRGTTDGSYSDEAGYEEGRRSMSSWTARGNRGGYERDERSLSAKDLIAIHEPMADDDEDEDVRGS